MASRGYERGERRAPARSARRAQDNNDYAADTDSPRRTRRAINEQSEESGASAATARSRSRPRPPAEDVSPSYANFNAAREREQDRSKYADRKVPPTPSSPPRPDRQTSQRQPRSRPQTPRGQTPLTSSPQTEDSDGRNGSRSTGRRLPPRKSSVTATQINDPSFSRDAFADDVSVTNVQTVGDDPEGAGVLSALLSRPKARTDAPASIRDRSARSGRSGRTARDTKETVAPTESQPEPAAPAAGRGFGFGISLGRQMAAAGAAVNRFIGRADPDANDKLPNADADDMYAGATLAHALSAFKSASPILDRSKSANGGGQDKSLMFRRNSRPLSSSAASIAIDLSDPSIMRQLTADAISDTDGFQIMSSDKYDAKRQQLTSLVSQINSLQNKLGLELRVREAAESFLKGVADNDSSQTTSARKELADAIGKTDSISADLWKAMGRLVDTERTVFMHLGGVLRYQIIQNDMLPVSKSRGELNELMSPGADDMDLRKRLASSDSRVRELEQQNSVLRSTVRRLELEQEPLRQVANDAQREARRARDAISTFETSATDGRKGSISDNEVNRMRLDLATSRAELTDILEQLSAKNDAMANLQLQLDEDQSLIESKDRMVSNLLGELEEATNQLEIVSAGAKADQRRLASVAASARAVLSDREQYNGRLEKESTSMNAALSLQLKESVLERERLRLMLNQERERSKELRDRARSPTISKRGPSSTTSRTRLRGQYGDGDAVTESSMDGDTVGGASSRYRNGGGSDAEAKAFELRRRLRDAERRSDQLDRLVRTLESDKSQLQSELQSVALSKSNQSQQEFDKLMEQHRRELEQERRLAEKRLKEAVFAGAERLTSQYEREMDSLKRDYEAAVSKNKAADEADDLRKRLEEAEAAVVSSKKQFFVERERLQERLEEAMEEARTTSAGASEKATEYAAQKKELDERIEKLDSELTLTKAKLEKLQADYDARVQDSSETTKKHTEELDALKKEHAGKVAELQARIDELAAVSVEIETLERDYKAKLKAREQEVEQISKQLLLEHEKRVKAMDDSKETQAAATDQVVRVERLLRDAEADIDKFRKLANEKDAEVLELKKQLRQKDKEMVDAAANASRGGAERRLMKQKDKEVEAARAETRTALADIAVLKRRIDQKEREIDDVKNEMKRRAQVTKDADASLEEVDRLQLMMVDLKTARAKLLDELEDARQAEQTLKTQVASLKTELERLKAPKSDALSLVDDSVKEKKEGEEGKKTEEPTVLGRLFSIF